MSDNLRDISPEDYNAHSPLLELVADETLRFISSLTVEEIMNIMPVSKALAAKVKSLAYEFPNKSTGYNPLTAFCGEAFRGLDASTLSHEAIFRASSQLRIISSAYGILRPTDIIKPYRLDFNKKVGPDYQNINKILKPRITVEIVKYVKENKIKDIINLLPADADDCLDWKIIRAFAKVHKILFKIISPSTGDLKTPIAKRLKELRGIMTRIILENDISTFDQLKSFENNYFVFSPADSKPLLPVFIAAE